jgi:hypothetical protein
MRNKYSILWIGCFILFGSVASAQSAQNSERKRNPKFEVIASFGVSDVFRAGDRTFGTKPNMGFGAEVSIWRGLRVGAEVNTTFGLAPTPVKCGSISPGPGLSPYPCTGSARQGVGATSAASFTGAWYFGTGRIQPYVVGGISLLRAREYLSESIVRSDHVELRETVSNETGLGPAFGVGLRASIGRGLSIRPELRLSDGTGISGSNLSQLRFSVALGYGW